MKLVPTEYDANLKDGDMNCIKQVEETYGKISKSIQYQKQELSGNIPSPSALSSQPTPSQGAYPSQDALTALAATLFNEPVAQQAQTPLRHSHMQQTPLQQS